MARRLNLLIHNPTSVTNCAFSPFSRPIPIKNFVYYNLNSKSKWKEKSIVLNTVTNTTASSRLSRKNDVISCTVRSNYTRLIHRTNENCSFTSECNTVLIIAHILLFRPFYFFFAVNFLVFLMMLSVIKLSIPFATHQQDMICHQQKTKKKYF